VDVMSAFTRLVLRLVGELTMVGIATMLFVLLIVGYVWACAISVAFHVPLVLPSVLMAVIVAWLVYATVRERRRMRSRR
jgi:large-conductance mechanosensitive channel